MPHPTPDDPTAALRALGVHHLRAGIIRTTLRLGQATAQDLMDELHVSRTTLVPHTQSLVDAGILTQTQDPTTAGARSGFNRLIWIVDRDVLDRYLTALQDAFR